MELRQRLPLEGEVKSEADEADTPREESTTQHQDLVQYVDRVNDHVAEVSRSLMRLLEASDAVDFERGPLLELRDALSDALDAPGVPGHQRLQPRRRTSHFD